MIPAPIVEFLHGPQVMYLGTRSKSLRPMVKRVFGALADAPNDTITFFLPEIESARTMSNLAENDRLALAVADGVSHRAYQFKGRYIGRRPCADEDRAVRDLYREKLIAHYLKHGRPRPDAFWGHFIIEPSVAVSMKVEQIFDQMPGPNAGKPVTFEPGS